jgi:uncharacterized repeat protein (TIGR01451 family)
MFTTRLAAALVAVVAFSAVALPGIASANTGSVKCDSTGIVFTYNTDFGRTKVVTETVDGATKLVTVQAHTLTTDTFPIFGTHTVGATWSGDSIPTVTLTCPAPAPPPPPVVTPPVAPPVVTPPVVSTPVAPPVVSTPVTAPVVSSTPETPASPPPVLSLRKKAGASTVAAGANVKYSLIVTSKGGTAHGVVVCDKLPAHMTYVALGTATMQDGKACWTVGDLTGSLTLTLTAKVDTDAPVGTLTNNATATSDNAGKAKAHASINVPARHGVKGKLKRTAGVTG